MANPKRILALALLLNCFIFNALSAQTAGYDIRVKLAGNFYDTLWLGRSFGKRAVAEFPVKKGADGWFSFKNDSTKTEGMYAVIYKRGPKAKYQFFPIWLPADARTFSLETDLNKPFANPVLENSPENELLYRYLRELDVLTDRRDSLAFEFRDVQDAESLKALGDAENRVRDFQEKFVRENPKSMTARLAESLLFPKSPAFEGSTEEIAAKRWGWYEQHYFEHVKPTEAAFYATPFGIEYLDYYTFKLPPPEPDSIKRAVNQVFNQLKLNADHFKYYFNYVANSFGSISKWRCDEVFVHIIREYIEKGQAPWTKPEELEKFRDDAKRMERVFVGMPAAAVTMFDKNEQPFQLYDIKAPFTLLIFWNPDCGHCKKELPILKTVLEAWHAKGVQIIGFCGKTQAEAPMCWKYVDENPFPGHWMILHDPQAKAKMGYYFNLRTFPRMFLLDAKKKIIWKRVGEVSEKELARVFEKFIER